MNDKDKEAFDYFWEYKCGVNSEDCGKDDVRIVWQAACDYKQKEYSNIMDAMTQTSQNNFKLGKELAYFKAIYNSLIDGAARDTEKINELQAENAKMRELVKMVENNSLMPHKHDDYYTRLCCLSERASEVLKELGEK